MPRLLGHNVKNTIAIVDGFTGETVEFEYRAPRTQERVDYQARSYKVSRKGRKAEIQSNLAEVRQFYGAKILTGVQPDYFRYVDENNQEKALDSSVEGFQDILLKYAPEMLEAIALQVFEGTYALANGVDAGEDEDEAGEEESEPGEA